MREREREKDLLPGFLQCQKRERDEELNQMCQKEFDNA